MGPTFIYNTGYYNWGNINGGIGNYQPGMNQQPYGQPYQQVNGPYGSISQGYQNGLNRPRGNPQGQFQGHPRGRQQSRQQTQQSNQSLLNQLLSAFTKTNNGGITKIMNKSTGRRATCNDIKQFLKYNGYNLSPSDTYHSYQPVPTSNTYVPYPSADPYQSGSSRRINNFNTYG